MLRFAGSISVRLGLCMFTMVGASYATEFRSRGAHVHGSATLNIALEGPTLEISFESPAINVIGFEHAPHSAGERSVLNQADQTFRDGNRLFITPKDAECRQVSAQRAPITYEHEGDDEKPGAPHADYDVTYRFICAHPQGLDWIDTRLFSVTRGMQAITVNFVSSTLQTQVQLGPERSRINLKAE